MNINLLVSLYKYAGRQGENFTTEAFVHLLEHMVVYQPTAAGRILSCLTGDQLVLSKFDPKTVRFTTQDITENGTPDVRIDAPGYLGYIEVKLGAALGKNQLSNYRKRLKNSGIAQTSLTLLTRYPYEIPQGEEPDVAIRWFQVAQWLENELASGILDSVSRYLAQQFLGFLEALNITIHQVHSGISEGLRAFLANNGDFFTNGTRYRNPGKLLESPELLPLYQLMYLLGEAAVGVKDHDGKNFQVRFDSGQHNGGWIGYNLNKMDYFIQVSVSQPEKLIFNTYRRPFDPALWDGAVGRYRRDRSPNRWENVLDLAAPEPGFFDLEKTQQFDLIQKFVQDSIEAAEKCSPVVQREQDQVVGNQE